MSDEKMVAEMMAAFGLLFIDDNDADPASLSVNCNDLFAWASADAEPLPATEIVHLYRRWKEVPGGYGAEVWACLRRGQRPQKPVEKRMREAGAWLPEMDLLPGAGP